MKRGHLRRNGTRSTPRVGPSGNGAADAAGSALFRFALPVEEGDVAARAPSPVGVVEMIGLHVVLVDRLLDQAQPELIHVVYCDVRVVDTQEFGPSEPIALEPKGGGGTNFRPVFEWAEKNNVLPSCLIYLTDLCCEKYPVSPPPYPVLWVTNSRRTAPFGETVRITAD